MLIGLDLNTNDSEALLRHCTDFQPASGDGREDSGLADALEALAIAIKGSMDTERSTVGLMDVIEPTWNSAEPTAALLVLLGHEVKTGRAIRVGRRASV